MRNSISIKACTRLAAGVLSPMVLLLMAALIAVGGASCGTRKAAQKKNDFFTSGSREADQRASQRMARDEQIAGADGSREKTTRKSKSGDSSGDSPQAGGTNKAVQVEGKLSLFERLGGEDGITKIVDDFIPRALQDPRINWQRAGVNKGGLFHRGNHDAVVWSGTPENTATLKKHFVQFLALATGGPAKYDGKEMKAVHANMHIANPEFDAAVGDLKASLDKLQMANKEQKELLAIVESTRPLVVTQR